MKEGKKEGHLFFLARLSLNFSSLKISSEDLLCSQMVICRCKVEFWVASRVPTVFLKYFQE